MHGLTSIHLVVCLTTGPKSLPKRALHIVRSRASSFKWEYPLLSLRSSKCFVRLLPCLPVTYIAPCLSITRCRRQILRKMWPIQFAFRLRISCRIFLCSLTVSNTSSFLTWSFQLIFSILLQHHISKLSRWKLPEASKFQHHIKLCSKCSTSLASSPIPSPMDLQTLKIFKTVFIWAVTRVTLLNDILVIRFIRKYICPIYNKLFQISRNLWL